MPKIHPTPDQEKAIQDFIAFTKSTSQRAFILKGYAGTGKTTTVRYFIDYLIKTELNYVLLASTGRAAKILSNKCNEPASTVHSQIYSFLDLDDDIEKMIEMQDKMGADDKGQLRLVFERKTLQADDSIYYFIDESSMVSDIPNSGSSAAYFGENGLLVDLFHYNPTGKFIFIGDSFQLPPIGQTFSPALTKDYLEKKYHLMVKEFELQTIKRQDEGNDLLKLANELRTNQASFLTNKWYVYYRFKRYQQVNIIEKEAFVDFYLEKIKGEAFENATIICQTNAQCNSLNKTVRKLRELNPNYLVIGDLLLITQNHYLTDLMNGDLVIVTGIGERENRAGLNFLEIEIEDLVFNRSYTVLLIADLLFKNQLNLDDQQHKRLMIDYYQRMIARGVKYRSKEFKDLMYTDPYLNALRAGYGYALTLHKAQGGEWNEVFLYLDNSILGIPKPQNFNWMYTAVTRAKEKLHVMDDWFIQY